MTGNKGLVCVTGAAGFLASWLVKRLLESGYTVRGTVRDPDNVQKTSHLWALPGAKERLSLVKADLISGDGFDDAVHGCEGVFHTASPVIFNVENPQTEIVDTAVHGTLHLLVACKKAHVKRVVITSSTSAVRYSGNLDPEDEIDESVWTSVDYCEKYKLWYPMSKTLSEKAAWDFASSNNLDLITIIPSFIVGYVLPKEPSSSVSEVLAILKGDTNFDKFPKMGYVHVDDVASAHIMLYEDAKSSGRYLCSALDATNTEILEFLKKQYPDYPLPNKFQESGTFFKPYKGYNCTKLMSSGFKFKGLCEMFDDCVNSFQLKGLLPVKS